MMNQNSCAQALSTNEIESIADINLNGNEAIESSRQGMNVENVQIATSNDVTIGNRIIYHGPITIHQQVLNQNRFNSPPTADVNRINNALSLPVFTPEIMGSLRIIERSEWLARPPAREMNALELPATRVIIAHTAGECATTHRECAEIVRKYQTEHIELKGWCDIAYNFLIGGDGSIYVGRGWDFEGAHSRAYDRRSICIAFIGDFSTNLPPECSLIAAQQLVQRGVELKKISNDYGLYGARQLITTVSPGNIIHQISRLGIIGPKTLFHLEFDERLARSIAKRLKYCSNSLDSLRFK